LRFILGSLGTVLIISVAMISSGAEPASLAPASPAHPPLGVNLESVNDYARSMMFVDAMKSARKFGSPDAPWDGNATVDANGWPTGDAGTVVMASVPAESGEYAFSCTGRCQLTTPATNATVHFLDYNRASNTTTAVVTLLPGGDHLFLGFKNTTGGVKNIRLLRPGYHRGTDQVFTKDFLAAIAPFSTLRLMDFTHTNSTQVTTWAARPHITDALQSSDNGVAWEYAIQLANQAGKDLWINVPDQADDDYVRQLAQLLKEKLNPDRAVYVEYSNEVWNSIFPQFGHNLDAAKAEVAAGKHVLDDSGKDNNQYYWAWKRVANRLVQITAIFSEVFGKDAINTRIRPVLASQSANPFMARTQVEFIEKTYGPPAKFIYGIAGAPYLGPDDAFKARDDLTLNDIFNKGFPDGFVWVKSVMLQYDVLARYYRLHSLCYEGATALEGDPSLPIKILANHDPRIEKVITKYLHLWYSQGGDLFMYYNLAGTYSKYGCWGLTDDIRKSTPKLKAATEIAAEPMPALTAGAVVPGTFPAWRFDGNSGGKVEDSTDGGKNVGFLADGNSLDYLLNVKDAGDYALTLQTATERDGATIELLLDGQSLGNLHTPNSGDWNHWACTPPLSLHLDAGQAVLRLKIVGQPSNIRSITLEKRSP
jgi:Carbohydrate binding module (family 6)